MQIKSFTNEPSSLCFRSLLRSLSLLSVGMQKTFFTHFQLKGENFTNEFSKPFLGTHQQTPSPPPTPHTHTTAKHPHNCNTLSQFHGRLQQCYAATLSFKTNADDLRGKQVLQHARALTLGSAISVFFTRRLINVYLLLCIYGRNKDTQIVAFFLTRVLMYIFFLCICIRGKKKITFIATRSVVFIKPVSENKSCFMSRFLACQKRKMTRKNCTCFEDCLFML